ncbi:MAG TPA: hypothetical protein PK605_01105 [Ignavibacteria bacterium]|nr:hypothetical protein [Bacteroidota bacterium]HRE09748.1 hypothetical protein [Ignavibacteria bacterium]HRF65525.1 hypothetical protein [Ignavibacteria bacterium]HRJ02979.1 hypothetical protein [Ignavibacteria bacterium]HRJ84216.1 hypothetical protein [Ignavibacteria bacterium]
MKSLLKDLLAHNNCDYEKYMYKVDCVNTITDVKHECFITTASTCNGSKFLFITREINQNWYESIKEIEMIVQDLVKNFNYTPKEYKMILHTYFRFIELENFYEITSKKEDILSKISIIQLETMLSKN